MTEENLKSLPEGTKAIMDNGYFNGLNLRYLEEKEVMALFNELVDSP